MPRLLALSTAAAAVAATVALAPSAADASTTSTPYLLEGMGFGVRVIGGDVPIDGGNTSHVSSGCTNKAPLDSTNKLAGVNLPGGLGSIGAVTSRTWTTVGSTGTVNRYTQSKVASVTIGNDLGSLNIQGLVVTSRAYHDKKGFHSKVTTTAASVSGKALGVPIPGKLPTPSNPIEIPGLLKLSAATIKQTHGDHYGLAYGSGLLLKLEPTDTTLRLAIARAKISDGFKTGIFGGQSNATRASVLGGTVTSSGQPSLKMKCQGTDGKVEKLSVASTPLSDVGLPLSLGAASASQMAKKGSTSATGRERAYIAKVVLGNESTGLVVNGLTAQANATRNGTNFNTVKVNKTGTQAAAITFNGQTYSLSQLNGQTLSIPGLEGVVKVQTGVTKGIKAGDKTIGLEVVGLRLTLLDVNDATKSVVDLATAKFQIKHP